MSAPLLIDVRSAGEFAAGAIEGAVNLPLDRFLAEITTVAPDRSAAVLLYCASGARSGAALGAMQQMGYTQAHNGGGIGMLALQLGRRIVHG